MSKANKCPCGGAPGGSTINCKSRTYCLDCGRTTHEYESSEAAIAEWNKGNTEPQAVHELRELTCNRIELWSKDQASIDLDNQQLRFDLEDSQKFQVGKTYRIAVYEEVANQS